MADFNTTPVVLNHERKVVHPLQGNSENPWFIDQRNGAPKRAITRGLTRALASQDVLPDDIDMDILADLVWKRKKKRSIKSKKVKMPVRASKAKRKNTSYLLKNRSRKLSNQGRNLRNSQRASRAHAHRISRSAPIYYRGRSPYGPHEPVTPNISQSNVPGSLNASLAAIAEEALNLDRPSEENH